MNNSNLTGAAASRAPRLACDGQGPDLPSAGMTPRLTPAGCVACLLKINVKDRVSGKLLGQISLASDVTAMAVRDNFIGWTKDNKFVDGKLNNTTIASTIVCTQPLGYNFLGGKLIAMMTTVPEVRNYWKSKYDNVLIQWVQHLCMVSIHNTMVFLYLKH